MRKRRATFDVAERINSGRGGLQCRIDDDEPGLVDGYAGCVQIETSVSAACRSRSRYGAGHRACAAFAFVTHGDVPRFIALDSFGGSLGVDANAVLFKDPAHGVRDVGILALDEARAALNDRYLRAEAAVHLAEFETDVATTDDDQVSR